MTAEALWAVLTGTAAFALYLATLRPGLGGPEDTPKFQYLGYVLGTAHPPGYPLHTMLTWAFSHLPIGSVAYRMNLFSAVCAAVAVGCVWIIARQLGAGRVAATGASLALACGTAFWWNATQAEVYSLGAALLALTVSATLRWARTHRSRDLSIAVAWAALAAGNHLTIGAVVPALVAFVLLTDWRLAVKPRALAVNALIVALGLAQYSYIVIRTYQEAPELEARARTLGDLVDVIRAERFSSLMFGFGLHTLLTERMPTIFAAFADEVHWYGAVLITLGLVALTRRDWRMMVLMAGGLAGTVALAVSVNGDVKGFLTPVFVLAAPLAALGIDAIGSLVGRPSRALAAGTVGALATAVPAMLVYTNLAQNDLHTETYYEVYFERLFAQLPEKAAFIAENYPIDGMVHYELIMSGRDRRLVRSRLPPRGDIVQNLRDRGYAVYAFESGAAALARQGFRFEPVELPSATLRDLLAEPHRTIVLAASQSDLPEALVSWVNGHSKRGMPTAGANQFNAAVIPTGAPGGGLVDSRSSPFALALSAGTSIGGVRLPIGIEAHAGADDARVAVAGESGSVAEPGIALAVLGPAGQVLDRAVFAPGAPVQLPLAMSRLPLYRVTNRASCVQLGDRVWRDITTTAARGTLHTYVDNYRPDVGRIIVYALADELLAPSAEAIWSSPDPDVRVQRFDRRNNTERGMLEKAIRNDGVTIPLDGTARFTWRIELSVNDRGDWAMSRLIFGGLAFQVLACGRADRIALPRVGVCEGELPAVMDDWVPGRGDVWLGPGGAEQFGAGWYGAEKPSASTPFRWTAALEARTLVPLEAPSALRVTVRLLPAPGVDRLGLRVNGIASPDQPLDTGEQERSWRVAATAWRAGVNEITLETPTIYQPGVADPDHRVRGVRVSRLRLQRE